MDPSRLRAVSLVPAGLDDDGEAPDSCNDPGFRRRESDVRSLAERLPETTTAPPIARPCHTSAAPSTAYPVGGAEFGALVGSTPTMCLLFDKARAIAPTELSVLIGGETGTGKELLARAIHDASARAARPFVVIDCASIPASLAESTLFGHERGAFTGATESRTSPFLEASGGSVFLDELGELPLELQPKLLRVIAERQVRSVGSRFAAGRPIDVRIIAASRRNLRRECGVGQFRDDL